jgi:hypothetical protein
MAISVNLDVFVHLRRQHMKRYQDILQNDKSRRIQDCLVSNIRLSEDPIQMATGSECHSFELGQVRISSSVDQIAIVC